MYENCRARLSNFSKRSHVLAYDDSTSDTALNYQYCVFTGGALFLLLTERLFLDDDLLHLLRPLRAPVSAPFSLPSSSS